jgi:putative transcriptional regulator
LSSIDLSFTSRNYASSGKILISDPFLDEDYFRRSVILICNHDDEGSFGLVLNNYVELDLHALEQTFPDIKAKVSVGGPVDTHSLFFIHTYKDLKEALEIKEGLFFGGRYDYLLEEIKKDPIIGATKARFFLGYSGWAKDQLKNELKENSWIVAENITNAEIMRTSDNDLWKSFLSKQGDRFKTISNFPLNPNDN